MQPRSCQEGERSRESPCLQCGFTPLAGDPKTMKTDKKHGSRQESHPLSDRPAIDWPCRTEYDATISFGPLFEPEDCQYGKSRLNTVPPAIIHRGVADPMDGEMDVQSGRISAGSPGGDGGWDEHAGSSPGVRSAPGHGAQNAGLFGPAGLSPPDSAQKAQAGALHQRHRPNPGGRPQASQEAAPHGKAHLRAAAG